MKPVLQVHVRLLPLLVHVAAALQPPLLMAHGSFAENTEQDGQRDDGAVYQLMVLSTD